MVLMYIQWPSTQVSIFPDIPVHLPQSGLRHVLSVKWASQVKSVPQNVCFSRLKKRNLTCMGIAKHIGEHVHGERFCKLSIENLLRYAQLYKGSGRVGMVKCWLRKTF